MSNLEECALLGTVMLGVQRVEFLLYGLASHLAYLPEFQDRRYKNLDPDAFLRGDVGDQKATLGQLVSDFGDRLLITGDEIRQFVDDRNLIAHNYWRLVHANVKGAPHLEDPKGFLENFANQCDYWENVLRGLLALAKTEAGDRSGTPIVLTDHEQNCIEIYRGAATAFVDRKP